MSRKATLAGFALSFVFPAVAHAQATPTAGTASIEEPAGAKIVVDLLTQTALVLTVQTPVSDVSSISVPASVEARGAGGDGSVALETNAALLDARSGIAPSGLSVSIGGPAGANQQEAGPMLILVQYN
ncbi:MAG: hypothetical protein EOP61_03095 [Sphingomonadales bacterium]|nr:MAG: hypothetical protein EOP61_03095 [Sphingomonadales bacterium]